MPDTRGYLQVGLYRDARRVMVSVHGLVMRAFVGPSSLTVNHIDHDKTNNRLANLEYLSHRRNKAHGCAKKRKLPTGVGLRPSGRYTASIRDANGKQTHLGMFDTPGEASEAYQAALAEIET